MQQRTRSPWWPMLDVCRTSFSTGMPTGERWERKILHFDSMVVLETRHISRTFGSPVERMASQSEGHGHRQKQGREKVSPRAKQRGISATSRIIGNPRWAKCKIRGCTSRLLSMIDGALNPISTVSCPYVLCTRQRWSFKNTTTGQKVKTHRGGRGTARQGTHQISSCLQHSPRAGSRFAVLRCISHSECRKGAERTKAQDDCTAETS